MPTLDPQKLEWFLNHGIEEVLPSKEALRTKLLSGDRIRVYLGVDPSGPTMHIGHAIALQKLAELQELGHEVILLLGDFTAMIGDPTDKLATRKQLTKEQVQENLIAYKEQAGRFLNFGGDNPVQIKFNNDWLGKMSFVDVIELAAHFTVQQMLERDMFEKRIAEGKPVHLHEFLYPLMQGYDSVAMDVDLEVGGNDQTFNMLAGRTLLKAIKGKEKFVMRCRLLTDPTGKKMGKSEGNMISLMDDPIDAYGKLMSWPDSMIISGFETLTNLSKEEIAVRKQKMEVGENPITLKRELAELVIGWAFSPEAAKQAAEHFTRVHQQGERPEEMAELELTEVELPILDLLVRGGLVTSKGEARRQVEQKAVHVDDVVIEDINTVIALRDGMVVQKGKRHFVKIVKK
jgi:tyrosyl-tRNA synthetase